MVKRSRAVLLAIYAVLLRSADEGQCHLVNDTLNVLTNLCRGLQKIHIERTINAVVKLKKNPHSGHLHCKSYESNYLYLSTQVLLHYFDKKLTIDKRLKVK